MEFTRDYLRGLHGLNLMEESMNHQKLWPKWLLGFAICASTAPNSAFAEEEDPFVIGGSCAALAYTTGTELADLLNETYSDDLGSFCVPEATMECSDYSPFLKGRGRLITGEDGYHCTLQLSR
jgi:hypothetical protein